MNNILHELLKSLYCKKLIEIMIIIIIIIAAWLLNNSYAKKNNLKKREEINRIDFYCCD
jgi:positive regulator of sigma E activity